LLAGTLKFNGFVIVDDKTLWTGGTVSGTAGGSILTTNTIQFLPQDSQDFQLKDLSGADLVTNAGGSWDAEGDSLSMEKGAQFHLVGTFNFNVEAFAIGLVLDATTKVTNAGTMRFLNGASLLLTAAFQNNGTVEIQNGTFALENGEAADNSQFTVGPGGILKFINEGKDAPGFTFDANAHLTGNGQVVVAGGTVNVLGGNVWDFDSGTTILDQAKDTVPAVLNLNAGGKTGNLHLLAGTLKFNDFLIVHDKTLWTGGTVSGTSGGSIFTTNSIQFLPQDPQDFQLKDLSGVDLATNTGGSWDAKDDSLAMQNGAQLHFAGIFDFNAGAFAIGVVDDATAKVTNAGTVNLLNGSGVMITAQFENNGTVEVKNGQFRLTQPYTQKSGSTVLGGGTLKVDAGFDLQGGALRGNGTVIGNVTNGGAVAPGFSPGKINITGAYMQTANGTLEIEIGGADPSNFDQLSVTGAVSLGGHLKLVSVNNFVPQNGATFDAISFGSSSGSFSQTNLSGFPPNVSALAAASGSVLRVTFSGLSAVVWTGEAGTTDWFTGLNWNTRSVPGPSDDVEIHADGDPRVILSGGTVAIHSLLLSGGTLRVENNATDVGTLQVAAGVVNRGRIEIAQASDNNFFATLSVPGGAFQNETEGTVLFGGPGSVDKSIGQLAGSIINSGTILVERVALLDGPSVANSGTITVNSGGQLNSFSTSYIHQPGAVLSGTGNSDWFGDNVELQADLTTPPSFGIFDGTIVSNGPDAHKLVVPAGAKLEMGDSTVNVPLEIVGTLTVVSSVKSPAGATVINGTITTSPGSTLRVETNGDSVATLQVAIGFINRGTVELLQSKDNNSFATLLVQSGAFENETGGTVVFGGAGAVPNSLGELAGTIINRGTIVAEQNGLIDGPSITNAGTITLNANANLNSFSLSYIHQSGAVLSGPGQFYLFGDKVELQADLTASTSLGVFTGIVTSTGPVTHKLIVPFGAKLELADATVNVPLDLAGTMSALASVSEKSFPPSLMEPLRRRPHRTSRSSPTLRRLRALTIQMPASRLPLASLTMALSNWFRPGAIRSKDLLLCT